MVTSRGGVMTHDHSSRMSEQNYLMNHAGNPEPIEILLVEDSPDDIVLTTEALKDGKVRNRVSVVGVRAAKLE